MRRKDAGNANEIKNFDAGVAQGQLEALQPGSMLADALRKENFSWYERFTHVDFLLVERKTAGSLFGDDPMKMRFQPACQVTRSSPNSQLPILRFPASGIPLY
jgi:hypothetical protein